ncbi:MAG TPA: SIMPL domain-containing protein [Candidatus Saccharimonadales bacterium]|nr:SIMPL domain-containing protein [Candidatus Saccharimonadales bacterium]
MRSNLMQSLVFSAGRWVAVGAASGLLIAAAAGPSIGPKSVLAVNPTTTTSEHTISVTGVGVVTLTPDTADVQLGVTLTRPTATAARNAAADAMSAVIDAIKTAGIPDADIQTSNLSLQPVYDNNSGPNGGQGKLIGFQVNNEVAVVAHDLSKVGGLVDAAVGAGATSVDGIDFRVNNQTQAESQARTAAVADAKAKADALAAAAGVAITGVSSIAEVTAPTPYPMAFAGAAPARDTSTPIQPGTTSITVTVTVVYVID